MDAAVTGFVTGLSLILAIGAQNALVLRQGIRRAHVAAICALSDATLIIAGVAGFGAVTAAIAGALAEVGMSANVIAGYHHDHIFVSQARAEDAMTVLRRLSA